MEVIKITLKIKSPTEESKNLDLTTRTEDIVESVTEFNDKFRDWSKRLIIQQIAKRAIHLLLVIEKKIIAENVSVREIRYFITQLRTEKAWNNFTREKNKMFETVEFVKLSRDEVMDYLRSIEKNELLYNVQVDDINFLKNSSSQNKITDVPSAMHMSDEEMMVTLEFLAKTQDKGEKAMEKVEDINKIKLILENWL